MPLFNQVIRHYTRVPSSVKDCNDEFMRSLREQLQELISATLAESITAREIQGGYVDLDEECPDKYVLYVLTKGGFERYIGAKKVPGKVPPSGRIDEARVQPRQLAIAREKADRETNLKALWSKTRDDGCSPEDRLLALRDLLRLSEAVPQFVATELMRDDVAEDWRDVLVFFAEDLHFPNDLRRGVGERLLFLASTLQHSARAWADRVAWAAMRRAATMLPPEPGRYLIFLDRRGVVDTRSVAMRCIQRMFEKSPPEDVRPINGIADRIVEFAMKFLDPDVFTGGENGLID
jgi:hypothetical protein